MGVQLLSAGASRRRRRRSKCRQACLAKEDYLGKARVRLGPKQQEQPRTKRGSSSNRRDTFQLCKTGGDTGRVPGGERLTKLPAVICREPSGASQGNTSPPPAQNQRRSFCRFLSRRDCTYISLKAALLHASRVWTVCSGSVAALNSQPCCSSGARASQARVIAAVLPSKFGARKPLTAACLFVAAPRSRASSDPSGDLFGHQVSYGSSYKRYVSSWLPRSSRVSYPG